MTPYILIMLMLALALGTTITFMSSHWMLAWMGLEINTLAIIPLMARQHHPRSVEASTKYFLVQATAAAMILFGSLTNAWFTGQWAINEISHPFPLTLITLALALKIGLAPLHVWLPEVIQGLDLTTGMVMSTWQKLAPFALLVQLPSHNSNMLSLMAIFSTIVGGWGGLNQVQLRKILAYSSIAHMGWMVLVLQYSPSLTLFALLVYITMTFSIFNMFNMNKATSINALATSWSKFPVIMAITPLALLSLGGLPPMTGFAPKWLILQELTNQNLLVLATLMAFSTLLSLYFYIRLSYAIALTIAPNNPSNITPWRFQTAYRTLPVSIAFILSTSMLPLTPMMLALLS